MLCEIQANQSNSLPLNISQSINVNKAHVIEIKAKSSLVVQILVNIVKVVHGSTKLFMADLLSNGLHEKVMIYYLKVD